MPASKTDALDTFLRRANIQEAIRKQQQGEGRPVVSWEHGGHRLVATGNTVHYSRNWKTFTDFLLHYIKRTLGEDWGNEEIKKPESERHQVIQWYQALAVYQGEHSKGDGGLYSAEMNGLIFCYIGLAYNLYLIKHNVELQDRLVSRLKDTRQFQGAYYELVVANTLIRAGFELELEDEQDESQKHCEFSARSKKTGEKYWVEAKMRSVAGLLGKTVVDSAKGPDPTSQLTKHLKQALAKPAPDRRMVFIDINGHPDKGGTEPSWAKQAIRRLESKESSLGDDEKAYLFVTNFSFHRALYETEVVAAALAYGLGMPDFGKTGQVRLPDWYKSKQQHLDAYEVMESLKRYPQIPDTFDGTPSSEAHHQGASTRLIRGETYFFEDIEDNGVVGTVISVAVLEQKGEAMVAISTPGGRSMILSAPLSESELADYKRYGGVYFGENSNPRKQLSTVFELYEWMVECYSRTPRERLLELAKDRPDIERLRALSDLDLVLEVCEGWALAAPSFGPSGSS